MKVLIVKLSAFGDIIHALPALDDILAQPEVSEVHWLVDARFAFVTDIFPEQVKVHQVALKGENRFSHAWRMIKTLRQEEFDIIFDLQGLIKSGLLAWLSAKRTCKVYGFDKQQSPEWPNAWFVNPVKFHPQEQHVVQKYRHIASAPFDNTQTPLTYHPPHIAQTSAIRLNISLPDNYTILHVGGGWKTKTLPTHTWQQCIRELSSLDVNIVISWGNEKERLLANTISKNTPAHILPQRLDMPRLCTFLKQAQAIIGMDTGVLHLAAALETPTITLWGPSASWNSAPLGEKHRHIESNPHCGPCFKRTCDDFICMPSISTSHIISAWQEVQR